MDKNKFLKTNIMDGLASVVLQDQGDGCLQALATIVELQNSFGEETDLLCMYPGVLKALAKRLASTKSSLTDLAIEAMCLSPGLAQKESRAMRSAAIIEHGGLCAAQNLFKRLEDESRQRKAMAIISMVMECPGGIDIFITMLDGIINYCSHFMDFAMRQRDYLVSSYSTFVIIYAARSPTTCNMVLSNPAIIFRIGELIDDPTCRAEIFQPAVISLCKMVDTSTSADAACHMIPRLESNLVAANICNRLIRSLQRLEAALMYTQVADEHILLAVAGVCCAIEKIALVFSCGLREALVNNGLVFVLESLTRAMQLLAVPVGEGSGNSVDNVIVTCKRLLHSIHSIHSIHDNHDNDGCVHQRPVIWIPIAEPKTVADIITQDVIDDVRMKLKSSGETKLDFSVYVDNLLAETTTQNGVAMGLCRKQCDMLSELVFGHVMSIADDARFVDVVYALSLRTHLCTSDVFTNNGVLRRLAGIGVENESMPVMCIKVLASLYNVLHVRGMDDSTEKTKRAVAIFDADIMVMLQVTCNRLEKCAEGQWAKVWLESVIKATTDVMIARLKK